MGAIGVCLRYIHLLQILFSCNFCLYYVFIFILSTVLLLDFSNGIFCYFYIGYSLRFFFLPLFVHSFLFTSTFRCFSRTLSRGRERTQIPRYEINYIYSSIFRTIQPFQFSLRPCISCRTVTRPRLIKRCLLPLSIDRAAVD